MENKILALARMTPQGMQVTREGFDQFKTVDKIAFNAMCDRIHTATLEGNDTEVRCAVNYLEILVYSNKVDCVLLCMDG